HYAYKVIERDFSQKLCGKHREGHFDGVLTVMMKFFTLVKPHRSYWGEKDYQQLQLIMNMVNTFFMDIEIIPCATTRDQENLALSSRNRRLTPEQIELARQFPKLLEAKLPLDTIKENLEKLGFSVDYIEEYNGRRFGAVHLGAVRLIDNMQIPS
ncbi:MAG: pantoate--beta-alanine ligase, partial [Proteobacteria bacterium]|nr:pantoate--beta-alanine ligase [Pseudomonadota bacterium]